MACNFSCKFYNNSVKKAFIDIMRKTFFFIFLLIFVLVSTNGFAQQRKLQNQPYADQRLFHLGFTLGLHTQDLLLTQSGFTNENNEVWFSEIPNYSPGFSVGIIGDMYLNRYMNLRLIPTLQLGDKNFVFKEQTSGEEFKTRVRNNYISVPLQVKIAAERINNYRPYVIFGGYGSVELASQKNRPILLKPYDYGFELGIGCDIYSPMFKLAPELKFNFGMMDALEKNRSDLIDQSLMKYPNSLSKATQRMITLSFNFE